MGFEINKASILVSSGWRLCILKGRLEAYIEHAGIVLANNGLHLSTSFYILLLFEEDSY